MQLHSILLACFLSRTCNLPCLHDVRNRWTMSQSWALLRDRFPNRPEVWARRSLTSSWRWPRVHFRPSPCTACWPDCRWLRCDLQGFVQTLEGNSPPLKREGGKNTKALLRRVGQDTWSNCLQKFIQIPGLYASFSKGQGHQGIFSLVKGTLKEVVNFDCSISRAPWQWPGGMEAITFVASKGTYEALYPSIIREQTKVKGTFI